MSGGASRRKGLTGEREVAARFEQDGFECRGLEGSGDWLAFRNRRPYIPPKRGTVPLTSDVVSLHLECKRAERLRLPEWLAQARSEAPSGIPAVVCFRQNRGEWYVALPLDDFLRLIG